MLHSPRFTRLILLFVPLSFLLYQCKDSQSAAVASEAVVTIPAEVQAFTSGVIGKEDALFVQFTEPPAADASRKVTTQPQTTGEATLQGTTLRYLPEGGWEAGVAYTATVRLPSGEDFTFTFATPERRAEVLSEGIYQKAGGAQGLMVMGKVMTNDASSAEEVQKMLSARQGSKALDIAVEASPGNQVFTYSVLGPDRGQNPEPVTIAYDGGAIGFKDLAGEVVVDIPADDDFRLTDVAVEDDGSMILRFSDVLEDKQDFRGQISFTTQQGGSGLPNSYTTAVDGNLLQVFPQGNSLGTVNLQVADGILNTTGKRLGMSSSWEVALGRTEPALRAVSDGAILPHQGKRLFPFEAVGVSAVQLEVVRIYENNVTQYLQDSDLGDASNDWQVSRVGRIIAQERIELSSLSAAVNTSRWSRYALDLGKYISGNSSAIYQVRMGFTMDDAVTNCGVGAEDFGLAPFSFATENDFNLGFSELRSQLGDYYGIHGSYADRNWEDRDDPCKPAYYNSNRFISQNVVSSNLGLIVKRNPDKSTVVFATDLIAATPRSGVTIKAFDRQRQELFSGTTDGEGRVTMTTERAPEVIMATSGEDVAYLDVYDQPSLPLSRFAIGGTAGAGGIKGAFYTERGVWRPGDSVFLNFVLEDRQARLPKNYPVEFVLYDPQSRVVERRTVNPAFESGLYPLTFTTDKGDLTGQWRAEVAAGGKSYSCPVLVETVKPNRLSIDLKLPQGGLTAANRQVTLESKWLYGAPGSNLKAQVDLSVFPRQTDFDAWSGYTFQDPAREVSNTYLGEVFSGTLNEAGRASFPVGVEEGTLPGPVALGVATKVFEPGGNFSIDNQQISYDPFAVYAGVNVPEDNWGSRRVPLEGGGNVAVGTINPAGEPVGGRNLSVGLYRVSWRYWWQDNYDNVARFSSSQHTEALNTWQVRTGNDGRANVRVAVSDWGRYLLRVCDSGGHCSGQYFYAGWNQEETDRESASLLRPVAAKESVEIGEKVTVSVPSSAGGNLLVSLETGAGTQEQFWVPAESGETEISFTADERMVPTVYANITMLQPYAQTTNDRPVRLFGVVPIEVKNPETILEPSIAASDAWTPKETVSVEVKEASGKPMTYTLAVVDEGLLGLTRFQTPNLHQQFFGKEALSVRTFDLYRFVIGSLNGDFGKVLAIGGDGSGDDEEDQTANRFEPVVRHLGPFRLAGGKTGKHNIELPNYIGAVRVMVVASDNRAYGSADKRIPVRQPLMVLPTLPRVLAPGERVDMPVNVFAMTDKVKNVSVSVAESEGLVNVTTPQQALSFSAAGNQLAYFPLQVGERQGIARFAVKGTGSGEAASQEIEIDVRHPNREVSRAETVAIAPGESKVLSYANFGVPGSRGALLELSNLPGMQLDRHLRYLLRYPYGCVEQTISPAFAQLYLDRVVELTPEQEQRRKENVAAGLSALRDFQTSSGGMAYWPGQRDAHPWATNYALHFIVEAERAGYSVPQDLKQKLTRFQAKVAKDWKEKNRVFYASTAQRRLDQSYRLYGLALAGKAEIGAMNRLKGRAAELNSTATFQLAAAYSLAGQQKAASELTNGVPTSVQAYREMGYTFGSDIRDMAMILESQLAKGDNSAASQQAFVLAERISKRRWLSTQEAAFAFVAIGKLSAGVDQQLSADFTAPGGGKTAVGATTGVFDIELPTRQDNASMQVKNTGSATLYATVITSGKPKAGEEQARSENLVLDVSYTTKEGAPIDVSNLPSGSEFMVKYTVRNPGTLGTSYRQLALRSLIPSGWEITNDRLDAGQGSNTGYTYQDFRDDGVYTFFHLRKGEAKTFTFTVTATYPGRYYLPAQTSEAMYSDQVQASVKGRWVEVGR